MKPSEDPDILAIPLEDQLQNLKRQYTDYLELNFGSLHFWRLGVSWKRSFCERIAEIMIDDIRQVVEIELAKVANKNV